MIGDALAAYFQAALSLRSNNPAIRGPAIRALIELALNAHGSVQARAERALIQEFGPYAGGGALLGCAAPIAEVHICDQQDRDCQTCPWLWRES